MAEQRKNSVARLTLVAAIIIVLAGIGLLWWRTRRMVEHDMRKTDTSAVAPAGTASPPAP